MPFLLDTNILSHLVRQPQGPIADRIAEVGEQNICTSIIVTAELRYGTAIRNSSRLTRQVETILGAIEIFSLEPPTDVIYGALRVRLERAG